MASHIIFVGAYSGKISTMYFDPDAPSLKLISTTSESAPGPSWQEIDHENKILYSTNDGSGNGGYVDTYSMGNNGELKHIARAEAGAEAVSIAIGDNGVVYSASYSGPSIASFQTDAKGAIKQIESIQLELLEDHASLANVNSDRQEAAHPHQVALDPSRKFLLVSDLGADYIRVYKIDGTRLIAQEPIAVTSGAGPRHVAFDITGKWMYLIEELSNMVGFFEITSSSEKFDVKMKQRLSTLGKNRGALHLPQSMPKPAELCISRDNKHLYVSNRHDASIAGEDTLAHYAIDQESGMLTFLNLYKSGGTNVRHFSWSKDEEFVACAHQDSNSVVISKRDVMTGVVDGQVAEIECEGPICVQWW